MKLGRTLLSTKCINGYDPHYPGRKLNSGRSATAGLLWFKTGRSARNKTISGVLPVKSFLLFSTVYLVMYILGFTLSPDFPLSV